MGQNPSTGYIVLRDDQKAGGVVTLTRNLTGGPRWCERPSLTHGFVRKPSSIKRAIGRQALWTKEAKFLCPATYNPETGYAEPSGDPISFAEFVAEVAKTRTATA